MARGSSLIRGDALHIPLRDESVDLVATSPPYFALRSYQDDGEHYDGQIGSEPTPADFLAALWAVTDELWRVLKPTGSLFVNLGDKYSGAGGPGGDYNKGGLRDGQPRMGPSEYWSRMAPRSTGAPTKSLMGLPWRFALGLVYPDMYRTDGIAGPQWTLRAEIIADKKNGLPESVTDRVRRSHENWFHLTRQGRYFAAVDEVREASRPENVRYFAERGPNTADTLERQATQPNNHNNSGRGIAVNPLGKSPGSVWPYVSEPLRIPEELNLTNHFAAFSQEFPRRIILGWSPNGICTACGEGRRPVVEKDYRSDGPRFTDRRTDGLHGQGLSGRGRGNQGGHGNATTEATITGYACACDVPIAATRPAVVLDPFVGTGTVPMVARALGRYGVGLDLSRDYLRLADWRINRSRHGAKSENRTNRERQGNLW